MFGGGQMTQPTEPCPGVTAPNSTRPLLRCTNCEHYSWASTGMEPLMRQQRDGTWHCQNEVPMGVVGR